MKNMRVASFLSVINDVIWGILIGVMPKVLLNLVVGSVNLYRYICDFTEVPVNLIRVILATMITFLLYATYFSINDYLANPSQGLLLTWLDFALILTALSVKRLRLFQLFMFLSAFIGGYAYYLLGIEQMIVIKTIVGFIMFHKLFINPLFPKLESVLFFWNK